LCSLIIKVFSKYLKKLFKIIFFCFQMFWCADIKNNF
jgi:hypothetical protein